jgi:sugar transferase (PEP-CTERM/EpsH1 system associated)
LRTIRILHVLHAFSAGGLENGIVNIINGSPDHFVHELCLLSKSGEFADRLKRPVVVHEMNKAGGNSLGIVIRLRELFSRRQFDIVHTRNWAAFDGVIAACLTPKPVLVHGEHGRDISDPEGRVFRRNFSRRLLAFRARKFVAVSKDLYGWLKDTVHIPVKKLEFIPNGVDTDRFSPGRDLPLREQLGIGRQEFVIGTIGRLDPVKNHQGLIRAVRLLQDRGHSVRLVIVGDGPMRRQLEEQLQTAGLAPQALRLGYRPDVDRFYRVFDTFVLNSFAEGMSNTLLEAMASGVPIVCTDTGGNGELVAHNTRGLLVKPGDDAGLADALDHFVRFSSERENLAISARRFTEERFSLQTMIRRYSSLYASLVS